MPTSHDAMTSRERIFATFRGEETDRLPVWLKMANRTWQNPQPQPYQSMEAAELLRAAGCDVMVQNRLTPECTTPHVEFHEQQTDGKRTRTWQTPDGPLTAEDTYDPYTQSWHPTGFPATTPQTLARLRWVFRDTRYHVPPEQVRLARQRQEQLEADDVVTTHGVGPGPLMNLVEHQCGPEDTVYLQMDAPELFREVLELMHQDRLRMLDAVLPATPADTFWLTENTSTTLISPTMFREHCMGHLDAYGRRIAEAGTIGVHHMCGTLGALLEDIDALPCPVNEAYTTKPLGDVTLAEGRTRMPSKALIGGTNATLWLEDVDDIVATVAEDLAACPDRRKIFLTSAGVLPAPVSFDKARRTVEAFKTL